MALQVFASQEEALAYLARRKAERDAFKARLAVLKTSAPLKQTKPDRGASKLVQAMSNEALAFAAQNPDHSPAGRDLARAVLMTRLGQEQADALIGRIIDDTPPPSFLSPANVARDDGVFWGAGLWIRRGLAWAAALSALVFISGLFFAEYTADLALARAQAAGVVSAAQVAEANRVPEVGETPPPGKEVAPDTLQKKTTLARSAELAPFAPEYRALDQASTEALGWSWFLFPVATLAVCLRGKPARVLLLRRFNDRSIGASVSRFSRRWLTPYGHVYSLADKVMKRNWLGVLFSWFSFNPFILLWRLINIPIAFVRRLGNRAVAGPILVKTGADFRNFAGRLIDRWGLNLEMQRTQRRAILVRTSDDWWKQVVLMLMHAADVIVVDVTEVAAGTRWELDTLKAEGVADRVVFVARQDRIAEAQADLTAHGFADQVDALIVYTKSGAVIDAKAFRTLMCETIRRKLQAAAPSVEAGSQGA
jgi:hypothetical protein